VLTVGPGGEPVRTPGDADSRLVQVPTDIVALRQQDPALARAWRQALRDVLVPAFADGLAVVAVTRDAWYLLARP
jgi:predicted GNAT superfamily acetyltransferase